MPYSMEYDDVFVAEQFPKNVEIQQEHQQEFQQETQQEPQRPIDNVKDSTPAKKEKIDPKKLIVYSEIMNRKY